MTDSKNEWLNLTDDERRAVVKMREKAAHAEGFEYCKRLALSCIPGAPISPDDAQQMRKTIAGLKP